jgi:protein-L-isoaspartate(D-aspartate) O-methyltransferase
MNRVVWLLIFTTLVLLLTSCSGLDETPPTPTKTMLMESSTTEVESDSGPSTEDPYTEIRQQLVDSAIEGRGITDPDVLRSMRMVPRHLFVPEEYRNMAYADHPLPIGYGQTISQPFIVAWMTELLALELGDKVLEIGTGSGYQAAVLAELGDVEVYSIEIIPELAEQAAYNLDAAGYSGLNLRQGDGYFGWEEHAPFDAIIVTAAPDHLPPSLVGQLTEDGRIVIPIGPPGGWQTLWRFVVEDGELVAYNLGLVSFVPFTREEESQNPAP